MKTFSGIFLLAVSLTAQLSHLHGAPSSNNKRTASKISATAEEFDVLCPLPQTRRMERFTFPGMEGHQGFVNKGCNFLTENPFLQSVQKYSDQFEIEVDCEGPYPWRRTYCTMVYLKSQEIRYFNVNSMGVCDYSSDSLFSSLSRSTGVCRPGINGRLQQGEDKDKQGSTYYQVEIPVGDSGKKVLADVHYKIRCGDLVYLDMENFRKKEDNEPLEEC